MSVEFFFPYKKFRTDSQIMIWMELSMEGVLMRKKFWENQDIPLGQIVQIVLPMLIGKTRRNAYILLSIYYEKISIICRFLEHQTLLELLYLLFDWDYFFKKKWFNLFISEFLSLNIFGSIIWLSTCITDTSLLSNYRTNV